MIIEWEECAEKPHAIIYHDQAVDYYEYEPIGYEYKGYRFHFEAGAQIELERLYPYLATMTEPNGTQWQCTYDYGYGAGFSEDELDETGYYIPYKNSDRDDR